MNQDHWAAALMNQYGRSLVRYAASITRDQQAAIEVVQNVFSEIQKLSFSDLDGIIPGYLYRECRSQALDILNRRKTTGGPAGEDPMPNFDEITAAGTEDDKNIRKIHGEIARLSPRQQEALRLKFNDGLNYSEIADIIGTSPHIISITVTEAVHRLRDAMKATFESVPQPKGKHGTGR